jgi:hypothetical protein
MEQNNYYETNNYLNAKKGISRIYTGQLISILAALCAGIGTAIITIRGTEAQDVSELINGNIGPLSLLGIGAVLAILAFLLEFLGIKKASEDEVGFTKALTFLVVGFVASLIGGFFTGRSEIVYEITDVISNVCNLLVTLFIISGTKSLAEKIGNEHVRSLASSTYKMIILIYLLAIALSVISLLIKNDTMAIVAGLLGLGILVLTVIAFVVFLKMLNQARKMF